MHYGWLRYLWLSFADHHNTAYHTLLPRTPPRFATRGHTFPPRFSHPLLYLCSSRIVRYIGSGWLLHMTRVTRRTHFKTFARLHYGTPLHTVTSLLVYPPHPTPPPHYHARRTTTYIPDVYTRFTALVAVCSLPQPARGRRVDLPNVPIPDYHPVYLCNCYLNHSMYYDIVQ